MLVAAIIEAEREVVRFLSLGPSPEQIIAFHPSQENAQRYYALVGQIREGAITEQEQQELERYRYIEHIMRLLKAEARIRLQERAS